MPWAAAAVALVAALVAGGLAIALYTLRTGASPMPALPGERRVLLHVLPRRVRGGAVELGAGWGGVALALARRYPGVPVTAYELSPLPWAFLRLRLLLQRRPNLRAERRDFFRASLAGAGLVVCYLDPGLMARLEEKLARELAPGAWVVSLGFAVPGWPPRQALPAPGWRGGRIYVYRVDGAGAGNP